MNLILISIGLLAGWLLGLLYFGGLWWTVDHLQKSQNPLALYLTSLVTRAAIVAVCVVAVLQHSHWLLAAGTVGFLAARFFLVTRSVRSLPGRSGKPLVPSTDRQRNGSTI